MLMAHFSLRSVRKSDGPDETEANMLAYGRRQGLSGHYVQQR